MSGSVYDKLAPFIQDYIYKNHWEEIRGIQIAACDVIFSSDSNLLLSSGTASGKTEAAFLPILTELYNRPSKSVGVLYISPLKALINDQFVRLNGLLEYSDIPVCKWHGDVSQNIKNKFLKEPKGVMQTTPESLEAMIMKNKPYVVAFFSDLRFIVIDEVHYFMNSPRGIQLLSVLERIQRLTDNIPRRVGLSATLNDYSSAEKWLNLGTSYNCVTPKVNAYGKKVRLSVNFFSTKNNVDESDNYDDYYDYLYRITKNKRCIIFSNSKAEVEKNIAELKAINDRKKSDSIYMVHHGNVSGMLREYTEKKMKNSESPITIGATVTLELGIDVGNLERIVQTDCPNSVSSFVQRLGRSGRKTLESEMYFVFKDNYNMDGSILEKINWNFIKCIAIIQLYIDEKWIEPIYIEHCPFSVLYHQTMSIMYSAGEMTPAALAQSVLTLSVFKNITQQEYRKFLLHLIDIGQLEVTENNTLIVGIKGEKIINNFNFYSVFSTAFEYTVCYGSEEIGTVSIKFPKGESFALAGFTWKVIDVDENSNCIYVKKIKGKSSNNWFSFCNTIIQTKLMKKIKEVLLCDNIYSYLSVSAKKLLTENRFEFCEFGLSDNHIVVFSDNTLGLFPWLGSKAMLAFYYYFISEGFECNIQYISSLPLYLKFSENCDFQKINSAYSKIKNTQINKANFQIVQDIELNGKFDRFIEKSLLKREYIEDYIDVLDMQQNIDY